MASFPNMYNTKIAGKSSRASMMKHDKTHVYKETWIRSSWILGKYLEKDIQQANVSMNEKMKAITRRIDLLSNNMKHFMEEVPGPQNVFMDHAKNAGDPWHPFVKAREWAN